MIFLYIRHIEDYIPTVIIDNKKLSYSEMEQLAINDGFDCIDDFFAWFNTDFTGKIIWFVDKKY